MNIRDLVFGPITKVIPVRRPLPRKTWPLTEEATERLLYVLSYLVPAMLGGVAGWLLGTGAFFVLSGRGH